MDAKKYLQQVKKLEKLIDNKRIEISKLRSQLTYKGISYGDKVQSSIDGNPTSETIARIVDYENELNNDIDKLIDLKKEITSLVDSIQDADIIDLIYQRYFHYLNWEEIAVNMGISCRGIYSLHGKALIEVQKRLSLQ